MTSFAESGSEIPPDRQVADRLTSERPVPTAQFRGNVARWLADRDPGYGPRPRRLRVTVTALVAVGLLLLLLAAFLFLRTI